MMGTPSCYADELAIVCANGGTERHDKTLLDTSNRKKCNSSTFTFADSTTDLPGCQQQGRNDQKIVAYSQARTSGGQNLFAQIFWNLRITKLQNMQFFFWESNFHFSRALSPWPWPDGSTSGLTSELLPAMSFFTSPNGFFSVAMPFQNEQVDSIGLTTLWTRLPVIWSRRCSNDARWLIRVARFNESSFPPTFEMIAVTFYKSRHGKKLQSVQDKQCIKKKQNTNTSRVQAIGILDWAHSSRADLHFKTSNLLLHTNESPHCQTSKVACL